MSLVDLGKRLLDAAKQGDTEEVRLLMTNGAPFTTDWLGTSPLHMAAQFGHVETAEVLLRAGISRDARTKVDRTPLHIASQEGHLEIVDLLLHHGADIEAKDMLRMTSLHWAVERGHHDVIICLLRNGANPDSSSKFFKTPSDIAMDNCRNDLVNLVSQYSSGKQQTSKNDLKRLILPLNSGNTSKSTPILLKAGVKNQVLPKKERRPIASNRSAKPIILQASYKSPETIHMTSREEKILPISEELDGDASSTSVLATLAALAEATAPNANLSTSDTLQWLETHGIAMLPNDTSTIVTSAVESGQTISLTEAGKLALNWVKDNSTNGKGSTEKQVAAKAVTQRIFTIVSDQTQIVGQNATPIMVVSGDNSDAKNSDDSPEDGNEKEKLKQELAAIKKQAEDYKARLEIKEHEAQQYKKQLEEMQGGSKDE